MCTTGAERSQGRSSSSAGSGSEQAEGADGPEREPDQEGGDADQGADRAQRTLRQRGRHPARRLLQAHGAVLTAPPPGGGAGSTETVNVCELLGQFVR